jgi:hypothetical protein
MTAARRNGLSLPDADLRIAGCKCPAAGSGLRSRRSGVALGEAHSALSEHRPFSRRCACALNSCRRRIRATPSRSTSVRYHIVRMHRSLPAMRRAGAIHDFGSAGSSTWVHSTGQARHPLSHLYSSMLPLARRAGAANATGGHRASRTHPATTRQSRQAISGHSRPLDASLSESSARLAAPRIAADSITGRRQPVSLRRSSIARRRRHEPGARDSAAVHVTGGTPPARGTRRSAIADAHRPAGLVSSVSDGPARGAARTRLPCRL